MSTLTVRVRNADRMITQVCAVSNGVEVEFADGCRGVVPFAEIPEIGDLSNLAAIELPNPYAVVLRSNRGESAELPWDFARHYCDVSYRSRIEAIGKAGRQKLGGRIRTLRKSAGMTQGALAAATRIGRVTLVRIENGEQSPRIETLIALSRALGRPVAELLGSEQVAPL
ncbi:MAG: helix-turn-helix transcriptional regulator [Dehalococcoidia bacterium]|nr:helix-turn-helix transcriptional regulator [Dehalococcoidia bacterium]